MNVDGPPSLISIWDLPKPHDVLAYKIIDGTHIAIQKDAVGTNKLNSFVIYFCSARTITFYRELLEDDFITIKVRREYTNLSTNQLTKQEN